MIVIGSECYENVCYKHGTANFSFSLRLRQGGLPRRGDSSKLEWLQHQANKAEVCSRHSPCKGLGRDPAQLRRSAAGGPGGVEREHPRALEPREGFRLYPRTGEGITGCLSWEHRFLSVV